MARPFTTRAPKSVVPVNAGYTLNALFAERERTLNVSRNRI